MPDVFVLSAGRSGSTLLSRMMQEHPRICSISEFWTSLFMRGFGDPELSGEAFWQLLSLPPSWFGNFIAKARAAGQIPSEIIYDETAGHYALEDCPPLLTMTLPALTPNPDKVYDALSSEVPTWGRARASIHAKRLFDGLKGQLGRDLWVERSGLSYWYVPDLVSAFPEARFVHLTRDGREVLLSMMGMRLFDPIVRVSWMINSVQTRRQLLRDWMFFRQRGFSRRFMLGFTDLERAITGQHGRVRPYSLPDRFDFARQAREYARFWAASAELGLRSMEALPPERLYTFRYEDMVADPAGTLSNLMEFVDPGGQHTDWIAAVADRPVPQRGRWGDLDPALAREIEEIISPMNSRLGYG